MSPKKSSANECEASLRRYALGFPEAHEDFPWGERVIKVKKKIFVFMGTSDGALSLSVKLPLSQTIALMMPFTEPTGYGLGKSGWVSARFEQNDHVPEDMLREWITESYRAVAPKKLAAALSDDAPARPRPAARSKNSGVRE